MKKEGNEGVNVAWAGVLTLLFFYDFNGGFGTTDFTGSADNTLAFVHWTGFFFPVDFYHFEDFYGTCVHTGAASRTFF